MADSLGGPLVRVTRGIGSRSASATPIRNPKSEIRNLLEWLCLGLAAPLLLFPRWYTLLGAGLIAVPWVVRRVATGRWSVPTAAHWPVVVLLVALGVSLLPSVSLEYSAPKFWGLVLGLATFYACLHTCRSERAIHWAALVLLGGGVLLAEVGMLGMAVPPEKIVGGLDLENAVPRLVVPIQTSTVVMQGFHSNEVAGVLTLFAPLAATFAVARGPLRALAIPSAILILITLVLTQSRGAVAGVAAALLVGLLWRGGRRGRLVGLAALALAGLVGLALLGSGGLSQLARDDSSSAAAISLAGRVELWRSGLAMLLDMPLTGIGLNTFPLVLRDFYPVVHRPSWSDALMPHAHNLYLQTALDLGLPGLLAFLALVGLAVRSGLRIADCGFRIADCEIRNPQSEIRNPTSAILAVGLLLGLLAHGIYSLADAVTLGAKPGPVLWAELGLLVALGKSGCRIADCGLRIADCEMRNSKSAIRNTKYLLGLVALALPLLVAPLAVNGARVALHHQSGISDVGLRISDLGFRVSKSEIRNPTFEIPDWLAWGPYGARLGAARAEAARARGEGEAELAALEAAVPGAPWDAALAWRLGELRLRRGDREGAVEAWRGAVLVEPLLARAATAQPAQRLDWFALAQAVAPADWRPYAGAAALLAGQQRERAALLLAEAVRLRGPDPARAALAERLGHPTAPLPREATVVATAIDAGLFAQASRLLAARADLAGAIYAAELAVQAEPTSAAHWSQLAELWQRSGQGGLAREAQLRAAELRR